MMARRLLAAGLLVMIWGCSPREPANPDPAKAPDASTAATTTVKFAVPGIT